MNSAAGIFSANNKKRPFEDVNIDIFKPDFEIKPKTLLNDGGEPECRFIFATPNPKSHIDTDVKIKESKQFHKPEATPQP